MATDDGIYLPWAEICVISQTRVSNNVSGEFRVLQIYEADEQRILTGVFVRMYGEPVLS
jgi:hypothetical protein